MKSWIHEISESYVAAHKPVRKDLKENYASLTEEQQFSLLSENVLNYLDEQLQNAFGFGVAHLTEEQLHEILEALAPIALKTAKVGATVLRTVAKGASKLPKGAKKVGTDIALASTVPMNNQEEQ